MAEYSFSQQWNFELSDSRWKTLTRGFRDRAVRCLEIGAWEGRTSCWISDHLLDHPESWLDIVDPFLPLYEDCYADIYKEKSADQSVFHRFKKNLAISKNSNKCSHFQITSEKFFRGSHYLYDFIYIDGDHSEHGAMIDITNSLRRLTPGGIIIVDDSNITTIRTALTSVEIPGDIIIIQNGMIHSQKQTVFHKLSK